MQVFELFLFFSQSSSLSRKLDMIHDVLLKRVDDQVYYRLKELAIPPQTYGMYVHACIRTHAVTLLQCTS